MQKGTTTHHIENARSRSIYRHKRKQKTSINYARISYRVMVLADAFWHLYAMFFSLLFWFVFIFRQRYANLFEKSSTLIGVVVFFFYFSKNKGNFVSKREQTERMAN